MWDDEYWLFEGLLQVLVYIQAVQMFELLIETMMDSLKRNILIEVMWYRYLYLKMMINREKITF
jgi:hypothetical protein